MHRLRFIITGVLAGELLSLVVLEGSAQAANAVTRAIEKANPCRGAKFKKLGMTIGIDNFKDATLESLKLDVNGDNASASLTGALTCRTSDGATVKGDASARFIATAVVNLGTCAVSGSTVHIISTGGTFGFAIDAIRGTVENAVANSISDRLQLLCK